MALKSYGVLIGRPINVKIGTGNSPHYEVHIVDDETDYRIAINVKSQESPSDLSYFSDDNYQHPILAELKDMPKGFHIIESKPGGVALDFIRGNLFDRTRMRILPPNMSGPDNDLNDEIDRYVQRAMADEDALIFAFGERWGPENNKKDQYFGFKPGNGIHDIHMNQGNDGRFTGDDGVWQDGGMLIYMKTENRWVAVFLKFQSQAWHTDNTTGHTINTTDNTTDNTTNNTGEVLTTPPISSGEPDLVVRIIAALVNPAGDDQGAETVTLLNTSREDISLEGWSIANKVKEKFGLSGTIKSGSTLVITLPANVPLSNKGGIITLLNKDGLKVHGVQYTKQQASRDGWTLTFN